MVADLAHDDRPALGSSLAVVMVRVTDIESNVSGRRCALFLRQPRVVASARNDIWDVRVLARLQRNSFSCGHRTGNLSALLRVVVVQRKAVHNTSL